MSRASRLAAGLALALALSTPASGRGEGPPVLSATLDTTATAVGASVYLTLEVGAAEGWLVDPPGKDLDLGPFRVRAVERIPRPEGAAYRLRIVPLEAGEIELPSIVLAAHGPGGEVRDVASEPIPLTVASNLPPPPEGEGETSPEEPEPAPLVGPKDAPRDWVYFGTFLAAFALAVAGGFYVFRKLRRRRREGEVAGPARAPRKPPRPAWEIALEDLDRIAAADYVGRGELSRQYVEVTETLRRYLEDRYGVPALESTTTDLNEHLAQAPLARDVSGRILGLLREADLVKFAKALPEPGQAHSTQGRARDLVLATIPSPPEATS